MTLGPDFVKFIIVSCLLGINAFFIRSLVQSINEVKLELGKLITEHSNSKEKLSDHSEDLKDLYRRTNDQEAKIAVLQNKMSAAEARILNIELKRQNESKSS